MLITQVLVLRRVPLQDLLTFKKVHISWRLNRIFSGAGVYWQDNSHHNLLENGLSSTTNNKSLFLWHIWPFFAENFRQIHGKNPNVRGGGGGASRFSQIPNFTEFFFKYLYQSLNLNLIVGPCTTLSRSHSIASAGDKSLALPGERSRYQTMIAKKSKHQQIKVKVYFPGLM